MRRVGRRGLVVTAGIVAVVSTLVLFTGTGSASVTSESDPAPRFGPRVASEIIPDVSLVVPVLGEESRRAVADQLGEIDGVTAVSTGTVTDNGGPSTVFYLSLREEATVTEEGGLASVPDHRRVIRDAERAIGDAAGQDQAVDDLLLIGGPAVADQMLAERYGRSVVWLVWFAVAAGLALGIVFGWLRGLAVAAVLGPAVAAAASVSNQLTGSFDGTIASTGLPGALAGLAVGLGVAIRLLFWFRDPPGVDGAEKLRLSLVDMALELALILSGLAVSAVIIGLLDVGPSPLTSIAVGSLIAALITGPVLGSALIFLIGRKEARPGFLPAAVPDGRDLPLLALSSITFLLLVLAGFGFGRPATGLAGVDDLQADSEPAVVAERLRTGGGDATSAIVALPSPGATQVDLEEWSRVAAEQDDVEWVDAGSVRYTSIGAVETDPADLLTGSTEGFAVVVLRSPSQDDLGRTALAELAALPMVGGPPELLGPVVDAADLAGSRLLVIASAVVLAVTGAVSVRVLTQSSTQSALSLFLRLLGGFALLGAFGLLLPGTTATVLVTAVGLLWLGVSMFELDLLRAIRDSGSQPDHPGQAGAFGLTGVGFGALVVVGASFAGGGPGTRSFGVGLAVGVAIELCAGALILRPALLGQRAAFHAAARPVRVVLHSGLDRDPAASGVEDPEWRRIVGDLLQAEFHFQAEPARAVLSSAFVPDTPLYRQAAAHHANLAEAGLQIVGRSPKLRSVKTVSGRDPISLAVTVDHPVRHLLNTEGVVVGVRKAERRSGVLWLSLADDGSYRIAESVELGSVPLPEVEPDLAEQERFEVEIGLGEIEDAETESQL